MRLFNLLHAACCMDATFFSIHFRSMDVGMVKPGSFETLLVPFDQQSPREKLTDDDGAAVKKRLHSNNSTSTRTSSASRNTPTTTTSIAAAIAKPYERRDDRTIFVGNLPVSINQKILTNAVEKVIDRAVVRSIRLSLDGDGEEGETQ